MRQLTNAVGSVTLARSYEQFGKLMSTAGNPLTLVMVWAAIDIAELITQLRSVDTPQASERVVIAFSTRAVGVGLLLWANIVSVAEGSTFNFQSIAPGAGLYLVAAAGLRLGVLPLHLPYSSETTLRRGIGTSLRLVSAAASFILLAHIPNESSVSTLTPFLIGLAVIAALYGPSTGSTASIPASSSSLAAMPWRAA